MVALCTCRSALILGKFLYVSVSVAKLTRLERGLGPIINGRYFVNGIV